MICTVPLLPKDSLVSGQRDKPGNKATHHGTNFNHDHLRRCLYYVVYVLCSVFLDSIPELIRLLFYVYNQPYVFIRQCSKHNVPTA